jgi:multidrug efflux pump subunit AcrB
VPLSDIATITDTFVDGDLLFRLNGDSTVGMEILIGQKENLLQISQVVNRVVEDFVPQLPSGIQAAV